MSGPNALRAHILLATDTRKHWEVTDGRLRVHEEGPFHALRDRRPADAIARPKHYDGLSGLRPAMAAVLVAHLGKLHDIVRRGFQGQRSTAEDGTSVVMLPGCFCRRDGPRRYLRRPFIDLQETTGHVVRYLESRDAPNRSAVVG